MVIDTIHSVTMAPPKRHKQSFQKSSATARLETISVNSLAANL